MTSSKGKGRQSLRRMRVEFASPASCWFGAAFSFAMVYPFALGLWVVIMGAIALQLERIGAPARNSAVQLMGIATLVAVPLLVAYKVAKTVYMRSRWRDIDLDELLCPDCGTHWADSTDGRCSECGYEWPRLHCPQCLYDLTANASGCCPECGCKLVHPRATDRS